MRLLHISDIHYRKEFSNKNVYESILSNMDSSFYRLKNLINSINDVDCIAVTGDLCDDGDSDDYSVLKEYLDGLNIPYVVCLGNHDDKRAFYKGWLNIDSNKPYMGIRVIDGISFVYFDNSEYGYSNGYIDNDRINWLSDALDKYPNSVILMHHQLYDMPGIPGLENRDSLVDLLNNKKVLAVLCGHTHWFKKDGNFYTAPSVSFRAINGKDEVIFSQSKGYCLYSILGDSIELIGENEKEEKFLGAWDPKKSKLF